MQSVGKRNINVFNHRHMVIYVENLKEYTQKILESMSAFSTFAEYKFSIQ